MVFDKEATMARFDKLFQQIGEIKREGGPRAEELHKKMEASIAEGQRQIEASEKALKRLRSMDDEQWWEECYQKGISGSGAPSEWLAKRKLQEA